MKGILFLVLILTLGVIGTSGCSSTQKYTVGNSKFQLPEKWTNGIDYTDPHNNSGLGFGL